MIKISQLFSKAKEKDPRVATYLKRAGVGAHNANQAEAIIEFEKGAPPKENSALLKALTGARDVQQLPHTDDNEWMALQAQASLRAEYKALTRYRTRSTQQKDPRALLELIANAQRYTGIVPSIETDIQRLRKLIK
ncbi:MAG: hypothetical protein AAB492_01915 [Patescibacteria group bacterium]